MNFLVGNLKPPEYILHMPRNRGSILHASWKKLHDTVCLFFVKKAIFTRKWWYGEKMYMPFNQYIIIHDLACKLCLFLWKKFMTIMILVRYTTFHKNCHIFQQVTDPWNLVLVISSPEYLLTYAKTQKFYLECFLKNTWEQSFFILDKKSYF